MSLIGLLNYFEQKRGQEEFGNLVNQYRVPGDPSQLPLGNTPQELDQAIAKQQGGWRGEGGLIAGGPPQEFYLRAAALPGYQQLAQQSLAGQQALERQQQQQVWESNNMTLAQKVSLETQQQQNDWNQKWEVFKFNNLSPFQQSQIEQDKARTGIAYQNLRLNQQESGLRMQKLQQEIDTNKLVQQFPALGLKPDQQIEYLANREKMNRGAEVAMDAYDYLNRAGSGEKVFDRATRQSLAAAYEQQVVPAMTSLIGTGTINVGDLEFVRSIIGRPGESFSLTSEERQKVGNIFQAIADERNRLYGLAGQRAPEIKPGQSAWARSRSQGAPSREQLIPWSP